MSGLDREHLLGWVGRQERCSDTLRPWPAAALTAAFDRDDPPAPGAPLPPFWHHLYFLPVIRADATGPDGHPARGGFLPPVPSPRRMWAGGRLTWYRPLVIGAEIERVSTIRSLDFKEGRSGPLVFVLVEHAFSDASGLVMVEEHDIVYREAAAPGAAENAAGPSPSSADLPWQRRWRPDPVLLFRYSALTYNGHRIHYDHPYVTTVEAYPGLIVHGPLIATLLLDLVRREAPTATVRTFSFRALAPVFADQDLDIRGARSGDTVQLRATTANGTVMRGEVGLG